MSVKTYDPKAVVVTFNGIPITGFTDGDFVQVAVANDAFAKKVGANGEVGRARSNDDTAEVTITLMQTSPSNKLLSDVHNLDKATGAGKGPLSIKDLNGESVWYFPDAWIKKAPDFTRGKEIADVAWVFDTGQPSESDMGGNYA